MDERLRAHVRERVDALPEGVRDCEACGATGEIAIRRSSLRPNPCADDVTLKCMSCYRTRTHGIPVDRETYEAELDQRDSRTLDFVNDGPSDVEENLAALGYIDY